MPTDNKLHTDIDALIELYLTGKLDKDGFIRLKEWCKLSPENRTYIRERLEVWFSTGVYMDTSRFDKKAAYRAFKLRTLATHKQNTLEEKFNRRIIYRVAVVALLVLLPLAYWRGGEEVKKNFTDIVMEAPLGSRSKVQLPDGTEVWLNAGSRITYSQGFGVEKRQIEFEGEGFFNVTHQKDKPFKILTQELNLCVLGTRFNFKNYQTDKEAIVALVEGEVAVQNRLKSMPLIYLLPNEKIVLNKQTKEMTKLKAYTQNASLWTQNELFFDEELLIDIAQNLSRSYNVPIEVCDSSRNKRFYGYFKVTKNSIEEVLKAMSATKRLKYRYENNKYILY